MTGLFGRAFAALFLLALVPAAPGFAAAFKDGAGRTVELPEKVNKIIPAGPPAEVLLYALAPEKLAGLVEAFPEAGQNFVPDAYRKLAVIPRLSRKPTAEDMEDLRHLSADLVVDYGNVGSGFVASIDRAQKDLGTPSILLDGKLTETPRVLRELGNAIGVSARAERLAGLAQKALDALAPLAAPDSHADRVSVYLARGSDGLLAARAGTSLSEAIDFAGGRNVTTAGSGAFHKMSVEDVVALAPDVVVFEDPAALKSPLRAALPAKTRIYLDQPTPFGALESPPSVNRLIGAVALAAILHPDRIAAAPALLTDLQDSFFGPLPAGQKFAPLLKE